MEGVEYHTVARSAGPVQVPAEPLADVGAHVVASGVVAENLTIETTLLT